MASHQKCLTDFEHITGEHVDLVDCDELH